jgi:hypothetical protein
MSDIVVMRDVIVVGGGCYGTFYATQLAKAKERGKARFRKVLVVDRDPACRARRELGEAPDREFVERDWTGFFDAFLASSDRAAAGAPQDFIVPSPLMPYSCSGVGRAARPGPLARSVGRRRSRAGHARHPL